MFVPSSRHSKGPAALLDLSTALLCPVLSIGELARGQWWGCLLLPAVSAVMSREGLLKAKAGNGPAWLRR